MSRLTQNLQTAAAADYLGVSQDTIRKWAAQGSITVHRNPANGYRLFKKAELDKFLAKTARPVKTVTKPK